MFRKNPESYIIPAKEALKKHDWAEAAKLWQVVLNKLKSNSPPEAYHRLAYSYRKQGLVNEAREIIDKGISLYPNDIQIAIENAEIVEKDVDYDEQVVRWHKVVTLTEPDVPEKVWLRLVHIFRVRNEVKKARSVLSKAIKSCPLSYKLQSEAISLAASENDWNEVVRFGSVLELDPKINPESVYVNLTKAYRKNGDHKSAQKVVRKGLLQFPDSLALLTESAKIATDAELWQDALTQWSSVLSSTSKLTDDVLTYNQQARLNASLIKRIINIKSYKKQISQYKNREVNNKIVIFTSFTEGYDELKPHEVLDNNFEYIVYTDFKADGMGIYKVRDLPTMNLDPGRLIRYIKTHPHKLFSNYQVAIWLDASIMIVGDLNPIINDFVQSGKVIGSSPHSQRNSVYEEFDACIKLEKDNPDIIRKQEEYYKLQKFSGNKLTENGLLMFNLADSRLSVALDLWWEQILKFSKRDQLSFNFALEKSGVEVHALMKPPINIRNHPSLVLAQHSKDYKSLAALKERLTAN